MSAVQNYIMAGLFQEVGEEQSADAGPNLLSSPHIGEGFDAGLVLLFLVSSMCLQPLNFFDFFKSEIFQSHS